MAKIGRNDPCPCGSGKKYKHCCMRKDQERARAGRSGQAVEPQPPVDTRVAAAKARWDEFEAANHEGRIALFYRTLDEGLMDEELAFEMLAHIRPQVQKKDEQNCFEALLDKLEAEAPDLYAHDAPYYTAWRIEDALLGGNTAAITNLVMIFAENPDQDIDKFFNVIDLLMYHDQVPALIAAMTAAWPKMEASEEVLPSGVDEFSQLLSALITFDYVEQTSDPQPDDPVLVERLAPYADTDPEVPGQNLSALLGRSGRRWSLANFGRNLGDKAWGRNVFLLSLEFLGELHRQAGVPYSKGELGRDQLCRYLFERRKGEYEEDTGLLAMLERGKRKRRRPTGPLHPLCPERKPFDRFLGELLNIINPQFHKAGCAMELVPAWMDFLSRRGLVTGDEAQRVLRKVRPLVDDLVRALSRSDPLLIPNLQEAWGNIPR